MKLTVKTICAGIFFLLFQLALTGGYAGAVIDGEGADQEYQMPNEPQGDEEIVEPEAIEQEGAGEEVYLEDQDQGENEPYGEIVEEEGAEQLEEGLEPEVMEAEGSQGEGGEVPAENEIEPEILEEKPME